MKPKKELGQNFLTSEEVADNLVWIGEVTKKDIVLEIGPGQGFVTEKLLEKAGSVIAVELDEELINPLKERFKTFVNKNASNLEIIHEDALQFLKTIRDTHPKITKIIASIPYQITSPLLHTLVKSKDQIQISVLLMQKEVAERITAIAPDANYMSIFLQTFFIVEKISDVDKSYFYPIPKVDGAIVKFTTLPNPKIKNEEIEKYIKFLHHGFTQQRKMLNKRFPNAVLEKAKINPTRRAETLGIEEWVDLFKVK